LDYIYQNLIADGAIVTIGKGLLVTLEISVLAVIFGTILGAFVCMARMSRKKPVSLIAQVYISVLRGSPVLMLLMLTYYVVFAKSGLSAIWIAVITYSINASAYIAELMRSALSSCDVGQVEAARTLGFSKFDAFRLITLPQAAKVAEPVYQSTIINLIQWTSVVGYITITDLTRVINTFSARTMKPLLMIITGMILYLGLSYLTVGVFVLIRNVKGKDGRNG